MIAGGLAMSMAPAAGFVAGLIPGAGIAMTGYGLYAMGQQSADIVANWGNMDTIDKFGSILPTLATLAGGFAARGAMGKGYRSGVKARNYTPVRATNLIHLTNAEGEAGVLSSGKLIGKHGIFAIPESAAGQGTLMRVARTGLTPGKTTTFVRIPGAANGQFQRPVPIGLYSMWKYLGGVRYAAAGSINMATGAISRGSADSVEGVDIVAPIFKFSVSKVFAEGSLPSLATLFGLTGTVNIATFTVTDTLTGLTITLAAGECLFEGVDFGDPRGDNGVEFAYDFSASPNATGLTVGSMTGIAKKGWEYIWERCQPVSGGLAMTQKPVCVYVDQVYKDGAFAGLGL
jgi:hypothetical protein